MNITINTDKVKKHIELIKNSQLENGIFPAAPSDDYFYAWIRDNVMICLGLLDTDNDAVIRCIRRWIDMLIEYDPIKLDYHTHVAPRKPHEYIHARYSAHDVREINVPWSHCQLDSIGGFLFIVGECIKRNKQLLRNEKDREIIQKLVLYLTTLRYYECEEDVGPWEEQEGKGVRTSSLAACVAGLRAVKDIVTVPDELIEKGVEALYELFPYETKSRKSDLAQLTAIWPYTGVFGKEMSEIIVKNVEKNLLKDKAVLRYQADSYYSTLEKQYGRGMPTESYINTEAQWVFGLGYLAIAHILLGNTDKAKQYIERFESLANENGEFPELYMADGTPNKNTPLLWCHAVYINAVQMHEEYKK